MSGNTSGDLSVLEFALILILRYCADPSRIPRVKVLSYSPYGEPEYSNPHPRQFDGGDVVL